ncbi:hypothetical protein LCGC14_1704670 [marine sediment metagenome]|uniref:ERF superfamily protein n=1 Tax=marine sediment metagenome TaxID=412755 RepID=A0A0F9HHH4_9ZZZZ
MDTDKKETTDLANSEPGELQVAPANPLMAIIQAASTNGEVDADKMLKLIEAAERVDATIARKDFTAGFAIAQANVGAVVKTKINPQTNSKYADLASVIDTAKPAYTKQGFSVIFYEGKADKDGDVRVCADVLHKAGHKETYHYDVPLGGKGIQGKVNMIDIHAKATSVTYGQRYLTCMIWNISTADADGNPPPVAKGPPEPSEKEKGYLAKMCDLMVDSVPEGMTLDRKRVQIVTYAKATAYPYNEEKAISGAKWLIDNLDKNNSWETVYAKP